jgi:hypothetical protein
MMYVTLLAEMTAGHALPFLFLLLLALPPQIFCH